MMKKFFALIVVFTVVLSLGVTVMADDVEIVTGAVSPLSGTSANENDPVLTNPPEEETQEWQAIQALAYEQIYSQMPTVTSSDILNWATTKGNEVIYILQVVAQPFAIVIFIIAAFMTLIGCIGKSDMIGKGVLGMALSLIIYSAILYAPVLLQSTAGWLSS